MSAICGSFDPRGGVCDIEGLRKMSSELILRGRGLPVACVDRGTAVCQLREGQGEVTSILSNGSIYTIVLDGEVCGCGELSSALMLGGEVSAAELLLRGYISLGTELFRRIRGAFALAVFDGGRRELILARDSEGRKPLYYTRLPSGVVGFSSEIKGLLPLLGTAEVDRGALAPMILGEGVTASELYRGISELPPSSFALCSPLGVRVCRYEGGAYSPDSLPPNTEALISHSGELPDENGLMAILRAFDYPEYDERIWGYFTCLRSLSGERRGVVIRDGVLNERALARADRLGAIHRVEVTLLEGEARELKSQRLKGEEKELRRRAAELLRAGNHLSLFVDTKAIFDSLGKQELVQRLCGYGRLIECEYWLRSYPVLPVRAT